MGLGQQRIPVELDAGLRGAECDLRLADFQEDGGGAGIEVGASHIGGGVGLFGFAVVPAAVQRGQRHGQFGHVGIAEA